MSASRTSGHEVAATLRILAARVGANNPARVKKLLAAADLHARAATESQK